MERNNKHIAESSRKFISWTLHKYAQAQTNNASNRYIYKYVPIARAYLQYYVITFLQVNSRGMLMRKFDIDAA
jgi:hypothetical protein